MTEDFKELLAQLHDEVTSQLLLKIRGGEATAAELAVAVKLLKDNGISADSRTSTKLGSLAASMPLPFGDDDAIQDLKH